MSLQKCLTVLGISLFFKIYMIYIYIYMIEYIYCEKMLMVLIMFFVCFFLNAQDHLSVKDDLDVFLWASSTDILENTLSNLVCIHIKHAGHLTFTVKQNRILLVSPPVESLKHTGFVFCWATAHLISHKPRYHERQDSISAWIALRFSFLSPCSPSVHGRKVFIMWSFWKAVETLMASDRCRIS